MLTTFTSFRLISSDLNKSIERTSSQPLVKREIDHYNKTIGSIKSIDAFVKNDRVFKFAMKAFGLEDMDYAKAFMKKCSRRAWNRARRWRTACPTSAMASLSKPSILRAMAS